MSENLLHDEAAPPAPPDRSGPSTLWLFGGAFAVFLFCYAMRPIADPDFWWHLKTGEFMVQNGGLLQCDPFSFTGDGVVSNREALILRGYWLWELTAYALHALPTGQPPSFLTPQAA